MCRSVEKELRLLLGVAKSIVGLLLFLVWVLFSGFSIYCIHVIRGLHLLATPRNYSGTPLIWSSMGQKSFANNNEVAVLKRIFLQENVWWFCQAAKKKNGYMTR